MPLILAEALPAWVAAMLGFIVGAILCYVLIRALTGGTIRRARMDADQIRQTARTEAEATKQRIELDAEKRATKRREELENELNDSRNELKQEQSRLAKREDTLDRKLEKISDREARMDVREGELNKLDDALKADRERLDGQLEEVKQRLSHIAKMTEDQAREAFMTEVREDAQHEAAALTRTILEEAEVEAKSQAREITLQAIQRYAAEHVAETTVRSVRIPSDDMKGRIIGREGRNIRALEKATGVDILVDDTPGVIAVSCFDPIRRATAAEALQRLVADGRVHPSRIEEIVETVSRDMQERIIKEGKDAVMESNIRGLSPKIVEAMGKLHFRTSFGQNILRHSVEVAYLCQIIADLLGLDGAIARRCGFLHDIGKAMDHEMEGGHPAIGMEFCRKHGEKSDIVLNAIGGHHSDIPAISPYTPIVMAADAVSGARPGARRESMEMYIKRLEQLEGIAKEIPNIEEAHAIQAGREVRVIINASRASDDDAFEAARAIAKRVEDEMTFPGEIKVSVIREVRAEATAR
jgi:ribonuclease Y